MIEFFPFRAVREKKESRRESHLKWAEKLTPRPSGKGQNAKDAVEAEAQESMGNEGMLPNDIVKVLAAREKQVFLSDSEDEKAEVKPTKRKRKPKTSGLVTVILKDTGPPAQCLQSSLEFLKKRKMQVSRSSSVLNNSNQALRLLSTSGLISKK